MLWKKKSFGTSEHVVVGGLKVWWHGSSAYINLYSQYLQVLQVVGLHNKTDLIVSLAEANGSISLLYLMRCSQVVTGSTRYILYFGCSFSSLFLLWSNAFLKQNSSWGSFFMNTLIKLFKTKTKNSLIDKLHKCRSAQVLIFQTKYFKNGASKLFTSWVFM